ncbi:MAG: tRNA glutamyl-Q synthetase [Actinobacteria bacterium]|nr:tRNA glutamyl-Q synthetase [Actinomycetota bacterium]
MLRTRIAPTPSGYLHIGNMVNFVLTARLATEHGGRLQLRIDDYDSTRVRAEYVEDIFATCQWLGISFDTGPSGVSEFERSYSLPHRIERHREALRDLAPIGYTCDCSRAAIAAGTVPSACIPRELPLSDPGVALRVRAPALSVELGSHTVDLADLGDFVAWRSDGLPSYQLGSLVDDRDSGTNLLVRGVDLLQSSAAQLYLARYIQAPAFSQARFWHHPLLTDDSGVKLSKSAGSQSQPARMLASRHEVHVLADRMWHDLGTL